MTDPRNTPSGERAVTGEQSESDFSSLVLPHEHKMIRARRAGVFGGKADAASSARSSIEEAHVVSPLGLAFSGGGIRSATFNLGVIQALAEQKLLRYVDYLSTVSGGGYIGSWLHGVIKQDQAERRPGPGQPPAASRRENADNAAKREEADPTRAVGNVEELLAPRLNPIPRRADEDPVTFLRKYSNYLAPRRGLFKADSWVIAFIWLRNVLLNQLILMPAIATFVALALIAVFLKQVRNRAAADMFDVGFNFVAGLIAFVALGAAGILVAANLRPIAAQSVQSTPIDRKSREREGRGLFIVALVFAAIVALGAAYFRRSIIPVGSFFVLCWIVAACIQAFGGFRKCFAARRGIDPVRWTTGTFHVFWMSLLTALVATVLVTGVWRLADGWAEQAWKHVIFGPPLVGLSLIAAVMLLVGLMGADYPDAAREWTARIGAMLGIAIAAWTVLLTLAVLGPWLVARIFTEVQSVGIGAIVAWVLTTAGGVLAGQSERTNGGTGQGIGGRALEFVSKIAPTVFLVGYIIAIAAGVHMLLGRYVRPDGYPLPAVAQPAKQYEVTVNTPEGANVAVTVNRAEPGWLDSALQPVVAFGARYPDLLIQGYGDRSRLAFLVVLVIGLSIVTAVASARININEFSLHHFYKNRLVRAYLGASRTYKAGTNGVDPASARRPNPVTGFDSLDDFPLSGLAPEPPPRWSGQAPWQPYFGPYPIVNATLNLNTGAELAQQERKAASFVFTPAYCGFDPKTAREERRAPDGSLNTTAGVRETWGYSERAGPSLGTTMAISGAAANPNSGFHTSGPMAFLLTVFNARLGWWLGNPRFAGPSAQPGPTFALKYLFAELLGQTTANTKFVNLSDGGHFDNLGLYELVRRRCRFIIVCDSEEDGKLEFGSLGGAIRKCRADFGVEIEIDPHRIRLNEKDRSGVHCVVGRILYPEREQVFDARLTEGFLHPPERPIQYSAGWLLYIKSSLTGDEPTDVQEYRSRCRAFPHESTGDQFFSESQFESYRRLGLHIGRTVFHGIRSPEEVNDKNYPPTHTGRMAYMFQQLARNWFAPIPVTPEAATRLADAYVDIMRGLADTDDVHGTFAQLQRARLAKTRLKPPALAASMALVQLMQNVYTEFQLEDPFNRGNPKNAGWIQVFREWVTSDALSDDLWNQIRDDYHPLFREFVQWLKSKDPGARDVPPRW